MVLAVGIHTLDLDDQLALAAAYKVECEATAQARPGWVPLGAQARIAAWRAENGWTRRLLGAFEGERLIGLANSSMANDTPDTSWVSVVVLPQHQHRGVGGSWAPRRTRTHGHAAFSSVVPMSGNIVVALGLDPEEPGIR